MHLQEFISLKLRKEEGSVAMIKDNHFFHQMHIFVKTAKPLLVILRMTNSNHPHMDKLRLMVLMVDDPIRLSMPELNYEDFLPL